MSRNILNQGGRTTNVNNIYVNTITADLPLQIANSGSTASSINLGGLNSYGTANQILQVNSGSDGLEYSSTITGDIVTDDITNSNNTTSMRYVKAVSPQVINRLEINNSTVNDRLLIYNLENMYSRQNRLIVDNATNNLIKVGNTTDVLQLINASGDITGNASTATKIASISNSDIVLLDASQTLTSKTLTSPILTSPELGTPQSGNLTNCTFPILNQDTTGNASTATKIASITNSDIVLLDASQTLENKTLREPILYSVSGQSGFLSNVNNRAILKYTEGVSTNTLELNNSGLTDILEIYGLSILKSRQNKQVFINTTDNELELGNAFDLFRLNHNGFQMKDANANIVMSNLLDSTSQKFTTVFGSGADRSFNSVNNTPLSIVNSSGDNFSDCRFRLYNVDLTSTSTSPVIEIIQQTTSTLSEGAYIFKSANTYDLFIQDSRNIRIEPAYGACATFTTTKCLEFQNANSDIKGIISTPSHPQTSTSRMRDIYCLDIYCEEISSADTILANQAIHSIFPLALLRGLDETGFGPSDSRSAMLELGVEQDATTDDHIYPIMRINSPAWSDSEFYNYVQSNSNNNDYYGWNYSYSGTLYYFLEFNSFGEVISYQDLICKADVDITGTCVVRGNLIKPAGTFRIRHPIKQEADKNKYLYHSFVEAPRADNIYSGKIQLQNGKATVNLDNNDWYQMTSGTFVKLNKDLRVFVNNNENFDRVIGKINGNELNILCENPKSNATIDWQVIGTRQDDEIKASTLTDDNGNLITEKIEIPDEEKQTDETKGRKIQKQDKVNKINHSHFKSLSKRLEQKIKKENAIHTSKRLIQTNADKKKVEKKTEDDTQTYQLLNKNG